MKSITRPAFATLRRAFGVLIFSVATAAGAQAVLPLDDPNTTLTVMQFSARDTASRPELMKRMAAVRDFMRKQPGCIENVLVQNINPDAKPHFVGVSRWASIKDWEGSWLKPEMQALVKSVTEVGELVPGAYRAVKQ